MLNLRYIDPIDVSLPAIPPYEFKGRKITTQGERQGQSKCKGPKEKRKICVQQFGPKVQSKSGFVQPIFRGSEKEGKCNQLESKVSKSSFIVCIKPSEAEAKQMVQNSEHAQSV